MKGNLHYKNDAHNNVASTKKSSHPRYHVMKGFCEALTGRRRFLSLSSRRLVRSKKFLRLAIIVISFVALLSLSLAFFRKKTFH
jgi:hypothetical protein